MDTIYDLVGIHMKTIYGQHIWFDIMIWHTYDNHIWTSYMIWRKLKFFDDENNSYQSIYWLISPYMIWLSNHIPFSNHIWFDIWFEILVDIWSHIWLSSEIICRPHMIICGPYMIWNPFPHMIWKPVYDDHIWFGRHMIPYMVGKSDEM